MCYRATPREDDNEDAKRSISERATSAVRQEVHSACCQWRYLMRSYDPATLN